MRHYGTNIIDRVSVMKRLVEEHIRSIDSDKNVKITDAEYQHWAAGYLFDGLRNVRYGQSFCNKFNVNDNILFYSNDVTTADQYIRKTYIK
jgi:hypothetical protein